MEHKEFYNFACSGCNQKIRLTVKEKNYGRKVEVTCPKCKKSNSITIENPNPIVAEIVGDYTAETSSDFEDVPPEVLEIVNKIGHKIVSDPEIRALLREAHNAGAGLIIAVGLGRLVHKPGIVEAKVGENGEIKDGTFTEEDQREFQKMFKIKL